MVPPLKYQLNMKVMIKAGASLDQSGSIPAGVGYILGYTDEFTLTNLNSSLYIQFMFNSLALISLICLFPFCFSATKTIAVHNLLTGPDLVGH